KKVFAILILTRSYGTSKKFKVFIHKSRLLLSHLDTISILSCCTCQRKVSIDAFFLSERSKDKGLNPLRFYIVCKTETPRETAVFVPIIYLHYLINYILSSKC